jgi:ribosomal protein L11 methyltransferase
VSRLYPALDLRWIAPPDEDRIGQALACVDEDGPVAVDDLDSGIRIFFLTEQSRRRAAVRLVAFDPDLDCQPVDVPDENWAERSQAALTPVRVGRIVITPPWLEETADDRHAREPDRPIVIRIQPSMGFGTGHHASTRLCLNLLQQAPLVNRAALDVGTGSGVLALASLALGATRVLAIDHDLDALTSARENLELNHATAAIALRELDVVSVDPALGVDTLGGTFDVITANLTAAVIERILPLFAFVVAREGRVILGGIQDHDVDRLVAAAARVGLTVERREDEDEWVGLAMRLRPAPDGPERR